MARRILGATARVSVGPTSAQGNGDSISGPVSDGGRYVAFPTIADNLVAGSPSGGTDGLLRDMVTGVLVSVVPPATPAGAHEWTWPTDMTPDGRYVTYTTTRRVAAADTNDHDDVYLYDRAAGTSELVSVTGGGAQSDGNCDSGWVSDNGRYVVFVAEATNLVPGDTNGKWDVFVRDRTAHTTVRVSVNSLGTQAGGDCSYPSISSDGRFVAFTCEGPGLVAGIPGGSDQVYVHDLMTHETVRASVTSAGVGANDVATGAFLSGNGRYVAFESKAGNLAPGDVNGVMDVYLHDLRTDETQLISRTPDGNGGNNPAFDASLSDDGRYVAFDSGASNLLAPTTNHYQDVFVADRGASAALVTFIDVPAGYPFRTAIQGLADGGIINGYDLGNGQREFRPANTVLRGQFAKMITGALRFLLDEGMSSPFVDLDVDTSTFDMAEFVAAAYSHGITQGVDATHYGPYRTINRAQAVTMITRAVQHLRPDLIATPPAGYRNTWGTGFSVDHGPNARLAEFNHLLDGLDLQGEAANPWAPMPRGEVAQVLWNVLQLTK